MLFAVARLPVYISVLSPWDHIWLFAIRYRMTLIQFRLQYVQYKNNQLISGNYDSCPLLILDRQLQIVHVLLWTREFELFELKWYIIYLIVQKLYYTCEVTYCWKSWNLGRCISVVTGSVVCILFSSLTKRAKSPKNGMPFFCYTKPRPLQNSAFHVCLDLVNRGNKM